MKFSDAKLVSLDCSPGQIQALGPQFTGTHTVFPFEGRNVVPSRIANNRNLQVSNNLQNIGSKTLFITGRVTWFINSFVNRPTEVLQKDLNSRLQVPHFEASAVTGYNVATTLKKIIASTIISIQKKLF